MKDRYLDVMVLFCFLAFFITFFNQRLARSKDPWELMVAPRVIIVKGAAESL